MGYKTTPLTMTAIYASQIRIAVNENTILQIQPSEMATDVPISNQHKLLNLNATIAIASKNYNDYTNAMSNYRKEFNHLADEATEELISQFLGSGQEYSDMLRDLKRYREKEEMIAKAALELNQNANQQVVKRIWDEKLAWCDNAIEIASAANWLYQSFGYGRYQDLPPYCQLISTNNE